VAWGEQAEDPKSIRETIMQGLYGNQPALLYAMSRPGSCAS
jgi:hypothetical protein